MGRRRSQSRHARARSACGVLWRWVAMSKRGQGRITFECGRQASGRAAGAAGAGASADAGGRRRPGRAGRLQPRLVRRQGRGAAQTQASGRLPDGSVAGIPTAARQQTQSRQQLQQSLGNLNRTAAAIAAQQAAQAAARQAAGNAAPAVPDGWPPAGCRSTRRRSRVVGPMPRRPSPAPRTAAAPSPSTRPPTAPFLTGRHSTSAATPRWTSASRPSGRC